MTIEHLDVKSTTPITVTGSMPRTDMSASPKLIKEDGVSAPVVTFEASIDKAGYNLAPIGTTIPELQRLIHEWAISKEWRGPNAETQRTTGDDIALIVSEASEALEAYREAGNPQDVWYTYTVEVNGIKFKDMTIEQVAVLLDVEDTDELESHMRELNLHPKPEGVGPELADLVIRVLDYCEEHELNLLHFLLEKMAHNGTREVRHGGKHL